MATFLDWISRPIVQEEDANGRPRSWSPMIGHLALTLAIAVVGALLSRYQGTTGLLGICLIIATAALSVGGSLGFLFAIPRVATQAEVAVAAATAANPSAAGTAASERAIERQQTQLLNTNNNLEKVSDWLTTMLVGVGLTQLGNIDSALVAFRLFLRDNAVLYPGQGLAQAGLLPVIGPMILVIGLLLGFIYFYVFTRVVIAPKFYDIEVDFRSDAPRQRVRAGEDAKVVKSVAEELPGTTAATRAVAATAAPSVDDALSVMFDALYQPEGYRNAIRVATALQSTDAINRPDYWFYLAAAHGQEMTAAGSVPEREAARIAALYAANRAVTLSPSYRARLWQISDPAGYDNDLAPFRDDPAFLAIVGRDTQGQVTPSTPTSEPTPVDGAQS